MSKFVADFDSLQYITNVLGHKVLDRNHSTLAKLITAINKQNEDITALDFCVSNITQHAQQTKQLFLASAFELNEKTDALSVPIQCLASSITEHSIKIHNCCTRFANKKISYLSILLEEETPNIVGDRWTWTEDI